MLSGMLHDSPAEVMQSDHPPSVWKIGDPKSMSARMVPAGTVTRWEFSPELTAWTKASSLSVFDSSLPKETMSTATLFFFSFLPTFTSLSCTPLPLSAEVNGQLAWCAHVTNRVEVARS
jgi:hypothetical protein